jgi:uncharacterized protein YeaO (DUF488 family)
MTRQARIDVARVYEPRTSDAERRVLVDRLWPRGLTTVAADLDSWCRDIAPSTTLRRWYAHRAARFSEFQERYLTELDDPIHIEAVLRLQAIAEREHLVLLTAVRDLNLSHAAILAERLCWGQALPRRGGGI